MEEGTHGTRPHRNPMYLGRFIGPYHMSLVMPVLGAARASLDEFEENVVTRPTYHPPIMPRREHFDTQRPFGYELMLTDLPSIAHDGGRNLHAILPPLGRHRHADFA